jgi:hypothetical protein
VRKSCEILKGAKSRDEKEFKNKLEEKMHMS